MRLLIVALFLAAQLSATCLADNSSGNAYRTSAISWLSGTAPNITIGAFQNTATAADFDGNGNRGDGNFNDEAGNLSMFVQHNTTNCSGFCGFHHTGTASAVYTTTHLNMGPYSVTHPNFTFWAVRKNSSAKTYQAVERLLGFEAAMTEESAASYVTEHTGGSDPAIWQFGSFRASRTAYNFIYKGILPTKVMLQMSHGIWPHDSSNLMVSPCENGTTAGFLSFNQGATISEVGTITDGGHPPGITFPYVLTQ